MRALTVTVFSSVLFLAFSSVALQGGAIDITSDCGSPCTSITYSGAPGSTATGTAVLLVINGIWTTLTDLGHSGQWISYDQTGLTGTGPLAGQVVNFTVNYSLDPLFKAESVTLNVLADDFAQAACPHGAFLMFRGIIVHRPRRGACRKPCIPTR